LELYFPHNIRRQKGEGKNRNMKFFQLIPSGQFGLENVAEEFGISGRTLQRNLSAENTSFNQMVKDIQKWCGNNRAILEYVLYEPDEKHTDSFAYCIVVTNKKSSNKHFFIR